MAVDGEVLNVLRWNTAAGDARQSIPPAKVQLHAPFDGQRPPTVTRATPTDASPSVCLPSSVIGFIPSFRQASFQPRMRSMAIIVMLKIE